MKQQQQQIGTIKKVLNLAVQYKLEWQCNGCGNINRITNSWEYFHQPKLSNPIRAEKQCKSCESFNKLVFYMTPNYVEFNYVCHLCDKKIKGSNVGPMPAKMVAGKKKYEWLFECKENCSLDINEVE